MRLSTLISSIALVLGGFAGFARAQGVFSGGSTAFDPQIRVVNSGALLDSVAVVSRDLKYVTITAKPSLSQLIAIRQFAILIPPSLGYVGSAAIQQQADRERGDLIRTPLPVPSLLDQRGITKID